MKQERTFSTYQGLVQSPSKQWRCACSSSPGLMLLFWPEEACVPPPISADGLWCCTSLEEISVKPLDCFATEAYARITDFDVNYSNFLLTVIESSFSALSQGRRLWMCYIHTNPREGLWGSPCADQRGPKGLILDLRAAVHQRSAMARTISQVGCGV